MLNRRAEEYRRLAGECLRLVATIATEEARSALIEMARVWSRLADEQDEALLPVLMPERGCQWAPAVRHRALLNLMSNANKFTERGSIAINARQN